MTGEATGIDGVGAPLHKAVNQNVPRYRLRGTNFAVDRRRDLPRLAAGVLWLTGPSARRVIRAAHRNDSRRAEARWARSAARWLDMRIAVTGIEHIDPEATYVMTPLHEGFVDVIALLHLPLQLRFVARDELETWTGLGPALTAGGHVVVTPENPRAAYRDLLEAAPPILERGESVVVFPQGSLLGVETAFTRGAFGLAQRTSRPILPVVITGSHRVWEHPFSPRVRFGERVDLQVLEPREAPTTAADIQALARSMKDLAHGAPTPARRYVPARDGYWDGYAFEIDPDYPHVQRQVATHRRIGDS